MTTYASGQDRDWLTSVERLQADGELHDLVRTDTSTFDYLLRIAQKLIDENEELYRLIAQLADHDTRPSSVADSPDSEVSAASGSGHPPAGGA